MTLRELLMGRYRLLKTDSYNLAHQFMNENNDFGIAHMYNRKGNGMVLYGFNERALNLLTRQITKDDVHDAVRVAKSMNLEFPEDLFLSVVKDFNGFYPIKIEALPDGSWSPRGTPFAQIRNTVQGFEQIVSWIEAYLMRAFFPSGCATHALMIRRYLEQNNLPIYHVHNFAERSYPTDEAAYWGDTAWGLAGLTGSDGIEGAAHFPEAGFKSIPAGAHKVVQNSKVEFDAYKRAIEYASMLDNKVVAMPTDTYDAERFINKYAPLLFEYAAMKGVMFNPRPDSGKVFSQASRLLRKMDEIDYKGLVVIGEGVSTKRIIEWDISFKGVGVNPARIVYGMGGNYHNWITRETHGWAMKAAYSNGRDVMKLAKGKESIAGEVELIRNYAGSVTVANPSEEIVCHTPSLYHIVYEYDPNTGMIKTEGETLPEIKARVEALVSVPLQEKVKFTESVKNRNYKVKVKLQ